jgi:FKBP-type peptidyl-prolyl cis-trans isomerase FkpA
MRYSVFTIALLSSMFFISCGRLDYKKTPSGLVYKVISDGKGQKIVDGDYIKYHIRYKVNDSIYLTTFDKQPEFIQVAKTGQRYHISELWTLMRKGDSAIVNQSIDSLMRRGAQIPPELKKSDLLIITVKILDIFKSDSAAQADQKQYFKAKEDADIAKLPAQKEAVKKYLADNKIEGYVETPSGAFVKIIQPGTGNIIDSGNYVSVLYTGTLLSKGTKFDSNVDSSFGHPGAYPFTVNVDPMAKGFTEGVRQLRKGAVAKIFIPAALAYGSAGRPPVIGPDEHLIFDITIADVQSKAPTQEIPQVVPEEVTDSIRRSREQKNK